jgi:hypothetical protein
MGSLRGDNGGEQPPGGGLPDLPPEWGTVIIPDDPAELEQEASQVRRELRRFTRRNRWRRRFHRPPIAQLHASRATPTLGLPLLIMAVAILATLTSLFALAWPGPASRLTASPPRKASPAPSTVPDLSLVAPDGSRAPIRNSLPAVFLLVDGCTCAELMINTAQAVPAGVNVVAVARTAPALPSTAPAGLRLRAVADPEGALRTAYGGAPPASGVIAILVKQSGEVIKTATGVTGIASFQPYLARLG